ncbi:uncharacterized protein LOC100179104 isoform X3 [Ciona intestinalis]
MDLLYAEPSSKKTPKEPKPSVRLEVSLSSQSDANVTEVSYAALLQGSVKKTKQSEKNGVDLDNPAKGDAESLARYYEAKYGGGGAGSGKKRRRDRIQDLADVGYGYDETDPFVDDSECYDEMVPSSLTTQFGGFYVNTGKLEFKQVSDDEELPLSANLHRKRKTSFFGSGDSGEEGDYKNANGLKYKKMVKKRKSSLDVEDKRRRKLSLQGKDKLNKLTKGPKKKPTKVQLLVAKAKAQHQQFSSSNQSQHTSSSAWEINVGSEAGSKPHYPNQEKIQNGGNNLVDMEQDLLNYLDTEAQINQFDKSSFHSDNSRSPAHHKHESELPHSIPALIKEQISSLTKMAKSNENEGKMKFFSAEVNNLLLGIEQGSQNLSTRDRSAVYQLLTLLVPCSKDTLIKRMKKLHSTKQDEDLRQPMHRLKLAIDEVMDDQMRQYDEECAAQQLAKLDDRVAAASTDEDEDGVVPPSGEEKTKRTYAPRRKFKWTDKIRTLFFDVVQAKVIQIEAQKNKTFQSAEENLKTFFENEVKVLWPKGWIQARMLFKESREIHYKITGNTFKHKKVVLSGNKKIVGGKVEKKAIVTNAVPQSVAMPSYVLPPPGTSAAKVSKQLFKDSGMSVSMTLNSEAVPEKNLKTDDIMNRVITNAQLEAALKKSAPKEQKSPLVSRDVVTSVANVSRAKEVTMVEKRVKNNSQSLFKMLETVAQPSSKAEISFDKSPKKTWHETKNSADRFTTSSSETHKVQKEATKVPYHPKSTGNTKPVTKKTFPKHGTTDRSTLEAMEQYNTELLKLALMVPPGNQPRDNNPLANILTMGYPGLLPPPPTGADDFANFMKLQQAAMQSQLQNPSFKPYLTNMPAQPSKHKPAKNFLSDQTGKFAEPSKVKPKITSHSSSNNNLNQKQSSFKPYDTSKSPVQKHTEIKVKKIQDPHNSSQSRHSAPHTSQPHLHQPKQSQSHTAASVHRDILTQHHKLVKPSVPIDRVKSQTFIPPSPSVSPHTPKSIHDKIQQSFQKSIFSPDWVISNSRTTSPLTSQNSSPRTAPLSSPRASPLSFTNHSVANTYTKQYPIGTGASLPGTVPSSPQLSYTPILNMNPLEPNFMSLPQGTINDRQRDKAAMDALVSVQNHQTGTRR